MIMKKVVQNITDVVGNISLATLIAWQKLTWLNFHKIQNLISIQACDRPNLKKTERGHAYITLWRPHKKRGGGFLKFVTCS